MEKSWKCLFTWKFQGPMSSYPLRTGKEGYWPELKRCCRGSTEFLHLTEQTWKLLSIISVFKPVIQYVQCTTYPYLSLRLYDKPVICPEAPTCTEQSFIRLNSWLYRVMWMMYFRMPTWKLASPWFPQQKACGIF